MSSNPYPSRRALREQERALRAAHGLPMRHAVVPANTLAAVFDPRNNALNVMRLFLAGVVAVVHASFLGFGRQPHLGVTEIGALAVDGFFVLSGFLVARSYLRLNSLRRYLWHRILRILPGFWACMLGTAFVVAPVLAVVDGRSPASVFSGDQSALTYLTANAALLMRQFGIAGLPGTGGNPDVVNGSLWTLFYEFGCYLMVAGLGVLGVLRRRGWVVLALVAGFWVLTIMSEAGMNPLGSTYLLRFGFVFLLGVAGHLFADRIPVSGLLALVSLALVVAALYLLTDYRALGAPAFGYLCLYAMVRLPIRYEPRWDLSYGLYVWHWPIAQLLVAVGFARATHVPFIAVVLLLTAGVAALSWNLVERPAMSFKNAAWVTARPFS